jgi:hypothetical protein
VGEFNHKLLEGYKHNDERRLRGLEKREKLRMLESR